MYSKRNSLFSSPRAIFVLLFLSTKFPQCPPFLFFSPLKWAKICKCNHASKSTHTDGRKKGKSTWKNSPPLGKKREYIESENSESKYPHLLTALCFQCSNPLSLSMWLMSCTNWSSLSLLGIPLWKEYWMSAELEREKCSAKQHLAKAIIYPAGGFFLARARA